MRHLIFPLLGVLSFLPFENVSGQKAQASNLVHTYSIVARDPDTGDMGVAVQSHWFSVGSIVSWAEAGVGAIATQSFVNVSFGPRGLQLLKEGRSAEEVLNELIEADEARDVRQLAVIDTKGRAAAYTGKRCIPMAGHYVGDNFSVQANMMVSDRVWPAMAEAFENARGPLAERMVAALEAAQGEGGDIRGKQSASLLVVRGTSTGKVWEDRLIDLRVDDSTEPVKEMKRLLKVYRGYEFMNKGDLAMENNDIRGALEAYGAAEKLLPDNIEVRYWHAIALANAGMVAESLPIFRRIFSQDENWRVMTQRLPAVDLLKVTDDDYRMILGQKDD